MTAVEKLLARVLSGESDTSIAFDDLSRVLRALGFAERVHGSHHIWSRRSIPDILNLQPDRGLAKRYQVRQVRRVILNYRLRLEK